MSRRVGFVLLVLFGALVVIFATVMQARRHPAAPPPSAATPPPQQRAPVPAAAPTLQAAFAAVYPDPHQTVSWKGARHAVRFKPMAVVPVDAATYAVVSLGQADEQAHVAEGVLSVAYLKGGETPERVGEVFLLPGSDGGDGAPPAVTLEKGLSAQPTLLVASSYLAQGLEQRWASLVRLGPAPTVVAERIPLAADDTGALGTCNITGALKPGGKDQLFAVVYQGAWTRAVTWTWDGTRWRSSEPGLQLTSKCPKS